MLIVRAAIKGDEKERGQHLSHADLNATVTNVLLVARNTTVVPCNQCQTNCGAAGFLAVFGPPELCRFVRPSRAFRSSTPGINNPAGNTGGFIVSIDYAKP